MEQQPTLVLPARWWMVPYDFSSQLDHLHDAMEAAEKLASKFFTEKARKGQSLKFDLVFLPDGNAFKCA